MKMILVVHNIALKDDVLDIFERNGIKKWTQIDNVKGSGGSSEPHLGTHIWPGTNSITFSVVDKSACERVLPELKNLKEKFKTEGVKIFILPVEEVI